MFVDGRTLGETAPNRCLGSKGTELLSGLNRLQLQEKAFPDLTNFIVTTQLGFDPIELNLVSQIFISYQKRFKTVPPSSVSIQLYL